jgi:hypothetical protein
MTTVPVHVLRFYKIIFRCDYINLLIKNNICIEISIICIWKKGYKVKMCFIKLGIGILTNEIEQMFNVHDVSAYICSGILYLDEVSDESKLQ